MDSRRKSCSIASPAIFGRPSLTRARFSASGRAASLRSVIPTVGRGAEAGGSRSGLVTSVGHGSRRSSFATLRSRSARASVERARSAIRGSPTSSIRGPRSLSKAPSRRWSCRHGPGSWMDGARRFWCSALSARRCASSIVSASRPTFSRRRAPDRGDRGLGGPRGRGGRAGCGRVRFRDRARRNRLAVTLPARRPARSPDALPRCTCRRDRCRRRSP